MRKIQLVLLVSAYVFTIANAQHVSVLNQFRNDLSISMVEKKPETIGRYFTDDIRLMPEFQKTIVGKANVLLYHKAFTSRFDVLNYQQTETEVLDLGAATTEMGSMAMKLKLKRTGKVYDVKGKYLRIWAKQANGTLLLRTEASNYDHGLEFEDELRFKDIPVIDVALQGHVPVNNSISFELAALNKLMEAAVSEHDPNVWAQFYTEDGVFGYSRNPLYAGKIAMTKFLVSHVKELPVFEKLDIRNDRIDPLGTYVIEYASHIAICRGGEWSGVGLGKDIRVWRREADGSLKIFRHFGMYD